MNSGILAKQAAPSRAATREGDAMPADPRPIAMVDEGLGKSSYLPPILLDLGDGRALAIDPERDPAPYLAAAGRRGLVIAYAAETHLHARAAERGAHPRSRAPTRPTRSLKISGRLAIVSEGSAGAGRRWRSRRRASGIGGLPRPGGRGLRTVSTAVSADKPRVKPKKRQRCCSRAASRASWAD